MCLEASSFSWRANSVASSCFTSSVNPYCTWKITRGGTTVYFEAVVVVEFFVVVAALDVVVAGGGVIVVLL